MTGTGRAERETAAAIRAAAFVSGAMIAFQMAGKATQNALFLSTFPVTTLPRVIVAAAAITIVAVVATSRMMSRFGPSRVVPALFLASAVLQLLEWALIAVRPAVAAVAVYLHYYALGALLISGFWSLVSERFDPRTLKRAVGPIGTSGAVGGLVGGLVAFRAADLLPVSAMLPILATLHLVCGVALIRVGAPPAAERPSPVAAPPRVEAVLLSLTRVGYLRTLVAVVLAATLAEGLLDYVFKAQARAAFGRGPELLRLFALFYMGVNLLSFVTQTGLSRRALERLGLARTVGALPWTVAVGGAGAIAVPGLVSALLARGAEMVARNSLYSSA